MDKEYEIIDLLFSDLIDEMAKEIIEKERVKGMELSSFKDKRDLLINQMAGSIERKIGLLWQGLILAVNGMKKYQKELVKGAENITRILQTIDRIDAEANLNQSLGISEEAIREIYSVGHELYGEGSVKEARAVFTLTTFLYPSISDFWFSLGISEQRLGNHDEALIAYGIAIGATPNDPKSYFWAARAAYHLQEYEVIKEIISMLKMMLEATNQMSEWKEKLRELEKEVQV